MSLSAEGLGKKSRSGAIRIGLSAYDRQYTPRSIGERGDVGLTAIRSYQVHQKGRLYLGNRSNRTDGRGYFAVPWAMESCQTVKEDPINYGIDNSCKCSGESYEAHIETLGGNAITWELHGSNRVCTSDLVMRCEGLCVKDKGVLEGQSSPVGSEI